MAADDGKRRCDYISYRGRALTAPRTDLPPTLIDVLQGSQNLYFGVDIVNKDSFRLSYFHLADGVSVKLASSGT